MARLSLEKIWFQLWAKIRQETCFCKPKCSFLSEFVSEFSHYTAMICGCHSKTSVAQCTEERSASSEDTYPLPFPACCRTAIPHRIIWSTRPQYGGSHLQQGDLKSSQTYLRRTGESKLAKALSFALAEQECGWHTPGRWKWLTQPRLTCSQVSHSILDCHQKSKYNVSINTKRSEHLSLTSYQYSGWYPIMLPT